MHRADVVDEHIDAPELVDGVAHELLGPVGVGEVDGDGSDAHDLLEGLDVARAGDHVGSLCRKLLGDRETDALARPRDDGDLVGQFKVHDQDTTGRLVTLSRARGSGLELELELAGVNRGAGARCLGGLHRSKHLRARVHVLGRLKLLEDYGRALRLVKQDLQTCGRHTGRWPARLFDPRQQLLHPLGAHVGEPDGTYVHSDPPHVR
jgi:hypothetical protein